MTNAKPKIADYPFTTLHPGLGVVRADDREFVLADIPGLIEGASEGAGLGDRFLAHLERCAALLHLVDGTAEDVAADYRVIVDEVEAYGPPLSDTPCIVALNKIDALTDDVIAEKRQALIEAGASDPFVVSGVSGAGVADVLRRMLVIVDETRKSEVQAEEDASSDGKGEGSWSPI